MKRKMIIAVVVILLCSLIAVGWIWGKPLVAQAKTLLGLDPQIVTGPAKDFTVNLLDPGLRRYLRVRLSFQYLDEKSLVKELDDRNPQIQDAIIGVFRGKTVNDFMVVGETAALRQELIDAVNNILTKGQITDLYFVEMVIQ